jgi:molybdate/tungstate transport system substrate-binding protein
MSGISSFERTTNRLWSRRPLTLSATVAALVLAGTLVGPLANSSATGATKVSGPVDVLYAGSFLDLMQQQIDPAFHKATGYTVSGFSAGSSALATEIAGGTQVGDVFISASPAVNASLEGAAHGNWVSSYDEFGTSPLVLGYNPKSRFAKALERFPWYNVVDRTGFLLGRTDPATDPKGVLAVDALTGVALSYDVPNLATLASSSSNIFPETSLVGELQAGQLDAGFFYGVEASAAHIKTVPLVRTDLAAQYTVAILNKAPHEAAAKAFVKFLLSAPGQKILKAHGITSVSPAKVVSAASSTAATTTTTTAPTTTTSAP